MIQRGACRSLAEVARLYVDTRLKDKSPSVRASKARALTQWLYDERRRVLKKPR